MTSFRALLLTALVALGVPASAGAHPLAPSVLSFEEQAEGTVTMRWRTPMKRPAGQSLRPAVPEACEATGPSSIEVDEDKSAVTETIREGGRFSRSWVTTAP